MRIAEPCEDVRSTRRTTRRGFRPSLVSSCSCCCGLHAAGDRPGPVPRRDTACSRRTSPGGSLALPPLRTDGRATFARLHPLPQMLPQPMCYVARPFHKSAWSAEAALWLYALGPAPGLLSPTLAHFGHGARRLCSTLRQALKPPGMRLTGQPSGEQALEPAIAVRCSRDPALPQRSVPARARAVNGQCVRIWSAGM